MYRQHRENVVFTDEKAMFLKKMPWVREAHYYAKEEGEESQNKGPFWRKAVLLYPHGLGAAFSAKSAFEKQHPKYALIEKFGTSTEASRAVLQSPGYPGTQLESSF